MLSSSRSFAALAVAAALTLGACGGSNSSSSSAEKTATPAAATPASSGGGETVKLAADASALKFDKTKLSAKAGKVTITLDNPSDIPHAIEIEGNGVEAKGDTITKGGVSKATADLKPGTYTYYCPIANHRQAGMEGKLTVK